MEFTAITRSHKKKFTQIEFTYNAMYGSPAHQSHRLKCNFDLVPFFYIFFFFLSKSIKFNKSKQNTNLSKFLLKTSKKK